MIAKKISPELLLLEIEDLIRSMPSQRDFAVNIDQCLPWLGRASAAMAEWDPLKGVLKFEPLVEALASPTRRDPLPSINAILVLLHRARSALQLSTVGPLSIAIDSGRVFDYFDELRRVIETAKVDLFFVDPYLDAEFVSRYLPHVSAGVRIRLLTGKTLPSLLSATKAFAAQSGAQVEVRCAGGFHDRYLFIDGLACYQSGASFKDGARKAPTTLTQITDAFDAMLSTYEKMWSAALPS